MAKAKRTTGNPEADNTSKELEEALKEERPALFDTVNRDKLKPPEIKSGFGRLVTCYVITKPQTMYTRLTQALTVGEKRGDRATLRKSLDNAEENARLAYNLFLTAKLERDRYKIEAEKVRGLMWGAATEALQQEKDAGTRAKQITDADVRCKAAAMFPDEWQNNELQLSRMEAMVDSFEWLSGRWKDRCKSLETMLSTLR